MGNNKNPFQSCIELHLFRIFSSGFNSSDSPPPQQKLLKKVFHLHTDIYVNGGSNESFKHGSLLCLKFILDKCMVNVIKCRQIEFKSTHRSSHNNIKGDILSTEAVCNSITRKLPRFYGPFLFASYSQIGLTLTHCGLPTMHGISYMNQNRMRLLLLTALPDPVMTNFNCSLRYLKTFFVAVESDFRN